ncbi:hypothetical protein OUZ56_029912 [Daphnia magna]|uniref:Uncharacterized protein n=1 Tax=Daphnia magna TaxID=35525 RepID=A0ABR0B888_9CRUS|nr:hypothetical protein OUZ56_029912 [Daphnia magna]
MAVEGDFGSGPNICLQTVTGHRGQRDLRVKLAQLVVIIYNHETNFALEQKYRNPTRLTGATTNN